MAESTKRKYDQIDSSKYESLAEATAGQILKQIATEYELQIENQAEFLTEEECDWFSEKVDSGADEEELEVWAEDHNIDTTYIKTIARADFFIRDFKIAIEIDGETYHDQIRDSWRDSELRKEVGIRTLRYQAKNVFYPIFKESILSDLRILIPRFEERNKSKLFAYIKGEGVEKNGQDTR